MTPLSAILIIIALERFSWYAYLGCLDIWQDAAAVGTLLFWSYLSPMFGGWLGSKFSLRSVILVGISLLITGYTYAAFGYNPLILLALGNGLFKPCLATLVGLVSPDRSRAYSKYYTAIQLGSIPSTIVGSYLHNKYGWAAAFGACAVAVGCSLAAVLISWPGLRLPENDVIADALADIARPAQWGKVAILLVGAILFFAGFQQQQTTLVEHAKHICHVVFPETVSTLNPVFAAALLSIGSLAAWSNLRGRLTLALGCLAAAFGLLSLGGTSLLWLIGWYALATVGEVLISPLGMDLITSLVPRRLGSIAMALWLGSLAIGGKLAGVLGMLEPHTAERISLLMSLCGALWFFVWLREPKKESVLQTVEV